MKENNPYAVFGLDADAPFEEVQAAKVRILGELDDNDRQRQVVEAAYDAILMQRLQLRKEGKVRVPDRIRYPEAVAPPQPIRVKPRPPQWWENWLEVLPAQQLVIPSVYLGGIFGLSFIATDKPYLILALALLGTTYFLRQKNNRLFRSFGLAAAVVFGSYALVSLAIPALPTVALGAIVAACLVAVWCLI